MRAALLVSLAACAPIVAPARSLPPPTFVIVHAKLPIAAADAIAVTGSTISAVGDSVALAARCRAPCEIVDVAGGFVMPGFHDAHAHPYAAGQASFELAVSGDIPAIVESVRAYVAAHSDLTWLHGRGWLSAVLAPTAAALDAISDTLPIVLTDNTGHNIWASSAALRLANITAATPDPPGGTIVRDAAGAPTGVLEDLAAGLVMRHQPAPTDAELDRAILAGEAMMLAVGITSFAESGTEPLSVARAYARLDAAGKLRARVLLWGPLAANEKNFLTWLDFGRALPASGKVHLVAFKGFADGTMAARTAALNAPYADDPGSGKLTYTDAKLAHLVQRANLEGYPAAIHAIGDRAVHQALDAFATSKTSLVNRVEHAAVVDPADLSRFAKLGIAASVQPIWMYGYATRASFSYVARLGLDRATRTSYAWKSLRDAGVMLMFGSDVPSSKLFDPISGIYTAMHRVFHDGEQFAPEQAIDGATALAAYTATAPAALGLHFGRLVVGQLADLIWLDRDPRDGARSIADDPLRMMWIGGVKVPRGQ